MSLDREAAPEHHPTNSSKLLLLLQDLAAKGLMPAAGAAAPTGPAPNPAAALAQLQALQAQMMGPAGGAAQGQHGQHGQQGQHHRGDEAGGRRPEIFREVCINNAPAKTRFHLTKRGTMSDIEQRWKVLVVVRGRYYPPGTPESEQQEEKPLCLRITPGGGLPQVGRTTQH